jgi:hypothetical protein
MYTLSYKSIHILFSSLYINHFLSWLICELSFLWSSSEICYFGMVSGTTFLFSWFAKRYPCPLNLSLMVEVCQVLMLFLLLDIEWSGKEGVNLKRAWINHGHGLKMAWKCLVCFSNITEATHLVSDDPGTEPEVYSWNPQPHVEGVGQGRAGPGVAGFGRRATSLQVEVTAEWEQTGMVLTLWGRTDESGNMVGTKGIVLPVAPQVGLWAMVTEAALVE